MRPDIDKDVLKQAANDMAADLGDLDDLPPELANTVANIYYRFYAYKAHITGSGKHAVAPYLQESKNFIDDFRRFNQFSAETISVFEGIQKIIKTFRDTKYPRIESRNYMTKFLLDTLKYRIDNAQDKSAIRRWIERGGSV